MNVSDAETPISPLPIESPLTVVPSAADNQQPSLQLKLVAVYPVRALTLPLMESAKCQVFDKGAVCLARQILREDIATGSR